MMAYNIMIFLYEIFDVKIQIFLQTLLYGIFILKGLFPHPNVSEFHLFSYLTPPFILSYRYIRGIIGVKILGRQQLQIIL